MDKKSKKLVIVSAILGIIVIILLATMALAKYVIKDEKDIEVTLRNVRISENEIEIIPSSWTNENVTVSISTKKNGEVYYKINESGEWKKYEKNFEVEENCNIYAKIKYTDGESPETVKEVTNIDKIKPTVEMVNPKNPITPDIQEYTILAGETTTNISKKLIAKDEGGSGLKTLNYAYSQSNTTEPTTYEEFKNEATVKKSATGGNWYIWTKVLDNAGNRAEETKVSPAYNVGYQISYDANGGTGAPKEQRKVHGTELKISEIIPTRTGYEFQGWATANTATTAELKEGENYTTDKAITLYAVWKKYKYLNTTTSKYYMKLSDALNEVKDKETIKAMDYAIETTAPTLATAKAITFDLNGQTVVMSNVTLTNNGTLTIAGANGTLTGSGADTITNNGTATITAGTVSSTDSKVIYNASANAKLTVSGGFVKCLNGDAIYNYANGTVTVTNGTINATGRAIYNNAGGAVNISGGELVSTGSNTIVNGENATGTTTISGGTIDNTATDNAGRPCVINYKGNVVIKDNANINSMYARTVLQYVGDGTIDIQGGTITNSSTTQNTLCYAVGAESGTVKISGGTISSKITNAVRLIVATVNISGGTISTSKGDAVYCASASGKLNISGGTITTTTSAGISMGYGTLTITGGTVKGSSYGIWTSDVNKPTVTIGENDGKISVTTPSITSTNGIGLYIPSGVTCNFYDGKIVGTSGKSISGTVTSTATNCVVIKTTSGSTETAVLGPSAPAVTAKLNNSSGAKYTAGTWTNQNVWVQLKSASIGAGIKEYQWYKNGAWTSSEITTASNAGTILFTATRNEAIRFRAIDENGVVSAETVFGVKIDKTGPTISSVTPSTTWDYSNDVTINATDNSAISAYAVTSTNTAPTEWIETTSVDLSKVQTKRENGASWARVFYHNNRGGSTMFANETEAKSVDTAYKFSVLGALDNYKDSTGNWEFMLQYPRDISGKYNRWKQTANPATTTVANGTGSETAPGYSAVHIDWNYDYWGGLTKSTAKETFINGSVGHGAWFYAIGAYVAWKGGIPGPNDTAVYKGTELWSRIDTLTKANKTSLTAKVGNLTTNGTYYVWVKDQFGNVSSKAITTSKVDTTAPTVTIKRTDYNTFSWSASDTQSGVLGYAITTTNSVPTSWTTSGTVTSGTRNISTAGTYYVWVKDNAGNIGKESINSYTATYDYNGTKNYIVPLSDTIKYTGFSGVANTCFNLGTIYKNDLKEGDQLTISFTVSYSGLTGASGQTPALWGQGCGNVTAWNPQFPPRENAENSKVYWMGTANNVTYTYRTRAFTSTDLTNDSWDYMVRTDYYSAGTVTITNVKAIRTTRETKVLLQGAELGTLPAPIERGYTLDGWYTASTGGTKISSTTTATANATYYAHWIQNKYKMTLAANGGTYNGTTANSTVTMTYGNDVNIGYPVKAGYTFNGWKDSTGKIYDRNLLKNADAPKEFVDNSKSTNAQGGWRTASVSGGTRYIVGFADPPLPGIRKGFRITASGTATSLDVCQDQVPLTVGKYYTISVWAKGSGALWLQAGNSSYAYKSFSMSNVTSWTKYSWTFKAGTDGSANNNMTNIYFGNHGATGTIDICGMKLEEGTGFKSSLWKNTAANTTLTAQWTANNYTVKIDPNGGTFNNSTSVATYTKTFGSTVAATAPTKTGYTFGGWVPVKTEAGATWAEVLYHNNQGGTTVFANETEAKSVNTAQKYSILGQLETFRANTSSQFEFLLKYDECGTQYNRWKQTSNPTSGTTISGYSAVSNSWTGDSWGGIAKSSSTAYTFLDGSPNDGTWWYAIGSYQSYKNGIPGPSQTIIMDGMSLYVKVNDDLSNINKAVTGVVNSSNNYIVRNDITLKAVWIPNKYTITYDNNYLDSDLATNSVLVGSYAYATTSTKTKTTIENLSAKYGREVQFTMNAGTSGGPYLSCTRLTVGETYTWSVYLKASRNITLATTGQEQGGRKLVNVSTSWQRMTYTFKANDNSYNAFVFYDPSGGWKDGDILYIHSLEIAKTSSLNTTTATKNYGNTLSTLPTPTRTGYTFAGWYTAPTGGTKIATTTAVPSSNTTYYAHWTVNKYYLDLNGNCDSSSVGKINDYGTANVDINGVNDVAGVTDYYKQWPYGTQYAINNIKATTGHTYNGVASGSLTGTITGTTSVSLKFTTNKYKVTLNNQGATTAGTTAYWYKYKKTTAVSGETIYYYTDEAMTASPMKGSKITIPTKTGYTFGGYYTATNGGGTMYVDANGVCQNNIYSNVAGNTTLYAKWTANKYKVTLNNQGATTAGTTAYWYKYKTTTTVSGETIYYYTDEAMTASPMKGSKITIPTKTGYTFGGYYTATNGGGTMYVNASGVCQNNIYSNVAGNTTLYAKWTLNTYTISYNLAGGSVATANPTSYNVTSNTITLKNPTRTGCTFLGWTGSNDISSGLGGYTTSNPYNAAGRDHFFGNAFNVTAGSTYRVIVTAKRTKGTIGLKGGIWYTAHTSGTAYEGYDSFTLAETLSGGWARYYRDVKVPAGKTQGKIYIQLEQSSSSGFTTAWSVADLSVIPQTTTTTIPKGSVGNRSYRANWKVNTYTVAYYNGATKLGSSTHTYGTAKALTTMTTLKGSQSGFSFYGWTTGTSTLTRTYTDGQSVNNLTSTNGGTITLYAIWKRTVTFYSGLSKATSKTETQYYNPKGGNYTVTCPTPAAISNWTTLGWRGDTSAAAKSYSSGGTSTSSASAFYAVYSRTLTLKYHGTMATTGSTESQTMTQYYNSNGSESVPTVALRKNGYTHEGYSFDKWAQDSLTGKQYAEGATWGWSPAVDDTTTTKTMYALWYRNCYQNLSTKKYYLRLSEAVSEAATNQTIKVLVAQTETTEPTVASGKAITIDTNGLTTTLDRVSLTNNGTLTVTGSGKIIAGNSYTITNNGTFTKTGTGTVENYSTTYWQAIINNEKATANINQGNITGAYRSIWNNGTLNVAGGTVSATSAECVANNGIMTVSSGSVTATKGNAINCIGTSKLTVTGGTISTVSGYVGVNNSSSGDVVVEGGTISGSIGYQGTSNGALYMLGGTISTGSISGATAAIKNTSTGTIRIYGGIVTTEKSYSGGPAIIATGSGQMYAYPAGNYSISGLSKTYKTTGARIIGASAAIDTTGATSKVLLYLGTGGTPSDTSPIIQGNSLGEGDAVIRGTSNTVRVIYHTGKIIGGKKSGNASGTYIYGMSPTVYSTASPHTGYKMSANGTTGSAIIVTLSKQ